MENIKKSKETITSQALSGSIWNTLAALIQRIGGLVFTIIIARLLFPEGFGLYNLVISVGLIFFMLSQVGIDRALIFYFSNSIKKKSDKKARDYFAYTFKLKIIILLILAFLLMITIYPMSIFIFHKPAMIIPLFMATIYMFFLSLDQFLASFFFCIKNVKYVALKELVFQSSKIILSVIFLVFIIKNPTPAQAFLILLLSSFLAILFSMYNINKKYPKIFSFSNKLDKNEKARVVKFASYLTLTSISIVLIGNIDTIALGIILDNTKYIGIYQAAFVLMSSISGLLGFGQVLLPIFVELKTKRLEEVFNKAFRYSMILSFPTAFGLSVLGGYFLVLIYGYEYVEGALPLYFLSLFIFLAAQVGLLIELFSSREKSKDYFPLLIFVIVLDVVLNFVLVKYLSYYSEVWAITGAAIATTFSWFIYCIGMTILARKKLNVRLDSKLIIKPLLASIIMVVVVYLIKVYLGDINLWKGVILVLSGILVYFISLILIKGLNKADYYIAKLIYNRIKSVITAIRQRTI
ncbi:MAG: oligosaccharide flippase family protein [Nanoarchaeota archaeon]|mgnify:FL=1